jgi:hypothetical protein
VALRMPCLVRWSLLFIATALLVALITPWQALAGPKLPGATTNAETLTNSAAVNQINGQTLAMNGGTLVLVADSEEEDRDEGRRGQNNERRRKQRAQDGGGGKAPNPNCTLIVPAAPRTAQGLATPYELVATNRRNGPCGQANVDQSAFVEATILDPATGALSIYRPLVIDRGTRPAAPPVMPKLAPDAVVGVWFGFQGDTLTLRGATDGFVNGLPGSPFGQFAYCGAPEFSAQPTPQCGRAN